MVDLIMLTAPFAVFALLATVIVSAESWEFIVANSIAFDENACLFTFNGLFLSNIGDCDY